MGTLIGPHTAETQRDADMYQQAAADHSGTVVACNVIAYRVVEKTLDGGDPWRWALVYDTARRDARWETYWTLTESGQWVQRADGSGYDRLAVAS